MIVLLLFFNACQEQQTPWEGDTLLFGHRGSGSGVYDGRLIENTLPSVSYALQFLDGTEIDLQMSADGTVWIFHDDEITHLCDTVPAAFPCVPLATDAYLKKQRICREGVEDKIYRLEEVLPLLNQPEFSDRFLSLDVKGYFTEACFKGRNASKEYLEQMAEEVHRLIREYQLADRVIIETSYTTFLDKMKALNPNVRCHYLGYHDFTSKMVKTLKKGYDGITFNLRDTSVYEANLQLAKDEGLEIQLWSVHSREELEKVLPLNPFAIQISKIPIEEFER